MISRPFISIIIPIRNESIFIEKTINSIMHQAANNFEFEIIITDGMSIDGTRGIINKLMNKIKEIRIIDNPDKIVSTGFNRALSIAKGDYIIRIDGHAEISDDFIKNSLDCFNTIDSHCVGGPIKHIANGLIGKVIVLAQTTKFGIGNVPFRQGVKDGRYVDTLAFGIYRREVFQKIGGYDIDLVKNQDDEFNFRMIQNNLKIWLDPSIKSIYYPRNSFLTLYKQYFKYGFYKIRVFQKRSGYASFRHLIPLFFVLYIICSLLLSLITNYNVPIIIVSILYLILSIIFSVREAIIHHTKNPIFLLLPFCYFIIHTSYGFGSFFGIFYFINKWSDNNVNDKYFDREKFVKNSK